MALTGLDIFKLLPKTNCGDCGVPTCLAFAMKLAGKAAEADACPHMSDDAKAALGDAQAPPIAALKIGSGDKAFTLGGELFEFRHDKKFNNETAFALALTDDDPAFEEKITQLAATAFERVGEPMRLNFIYLTGGSDAAAYAAKAKHAYDTTGLPLILAAPLAACTAAAPALKGNVVVRPADDSEGAANAAELKDIPVIIRADSYDALLALAGKLAGRPLILEPQAQSIAQMVASNAKLRRAALKEGNKAAGHPLCNLFPAGLDTYSESIWAATAICKFASIIVLRHWSGSQLYPLLTLRQNIFSDPQRPLQMEPKVYEVGEPTPDSPAIVTTNFSLTYFIVSAEIDGSSQPGHLLLVECEGMSVLTAWSAGKFNGEIIAKAVNESGLADRISHRKLIIPGHVARLSGELEDALPGWEIMVGPPEASDIPAYFKEVWK